MGFFFLQVQTTRSVNNLTLRIIWTYNKSPQRQITAEESNQNVLYMYVPRRFQLSGIRDIQGIRVRIIETRMYLVTIVKIQIRSPQ